MTTITVWKSRDGAYRGFHCRGHADYAEAGSDIVCAAISILVINTINSVEQFGGQKFICTQNEEEGIICFELTNLPTKETKLLLDSMLLGLEDIQKQYSETYLKLEFKEV